MPGKAVTPHANKTALRETITKAVDYLSVPRGSRPKDESFAWERLCRRMADEASALSMPAPIRWNPETSETTLTLPDGKWGGTCLPDQLEQRHYEEFRADMINLLKDWLLALPPAAERADEPANGKGWLSRKDILAEYPDEGGKRVYGRLVKWKRTHEDDVKSLDTQSGAPRYLYPRDVVAQFIKEDRLKHGEYRPDLSATFPHK